jgi:hypothetical protein
MGSELVRSQKRHNTEDIFEAISRESVKKSDSNGALEPAPAQTLEEHRVFREARCLGSATTDSSWRSTILAELDDSTRKCVTQSGELFRKKLRVGDMLVDEHRCQQIIRHPNAKFRLFWDLSGFLLIIYDVIVIPLFFFDLPEEGGFSMWVNVFTSIWWTVDIGICFITGYHVDGFLEMRPSRIARRYVRSWFGPDITIVLMDWAFVFIGLGDGAGILRIRRSVRALRIIRALRLVRLAKVKETFTKITDGINSEFGLIFLNIFKLVLCVVLLNHYIACLWYAIGRMDHVDNTRSCSWVRKHEVDDYDASKAYKYLTSLHWSMTQFMPASMEVNPCTEVERAFTICVLIFGLVTFSWIVSSITNVMAQLANISKDRTKAEHNLRQYLNENRVSVDLGMRIRKYFRDNYEARRKRVHEPDISFFGSLPEVLKLELRREIYMPVITLHPLLEQYAHVDTAGIWLVCHLAMSQQSWLPGQTIFLRGERASEMLMVMTGELEYSCHLTSAIDVEMDQWLCEAVLWSEKWHYCGRLVAKKTCEIYGISAAKFRAVTGERLTSFQYLQKYAGKFMATLRSAEKMSLYVTDLCQDIDALSELVLSVFEDDGADADGGHDGDDDDKPPQVESPSRPGRQISSERFQSGGQSGGSSGLRIERTASMASLSMVERRAPQRVVANEVENDNGSVRSV